VTTTRDELAQLQDAAMQHLLEIRKQAAIIARLTDRARVTSTLFVRASRVTEQFARRAGGLQQQATNRSIDLSVRRLEHLLLVKRLERLAEIAGDGRPPQLRRAAADLREADNLIRQWATDPQTAVEGDHTDDGA
jgi:hypothetical protein